MREGYAKDAWVRLGCGSGFQWLFPTSAFRGQRKMQSPADGKDNFENVSRSLQRVSIKSIAKHLGLSTTTISVVVNAAPAAKAISQETKDRILKAAQELNYRPNYFAPS